MSVLSFRDWAYQEGYTWPLDSVDIVDAQPAYQEYLRLHRPTKTIDEIINREDKKMHGTCTNCGRPDKWLAPLTPPICGTCQKAASGLKGPEREVALQKIKELIQSGGLGRGGPRKQKDRTPVLKPKKEKPPIVNQQKGDDVIAKLLERYEATIDSAAAIMNALLAVRQCGFNFEMPTRKIVGSE